MTTENEEGEDGVMITIGEAVFFVPQTDLQDFRLSDEAAQAYRDSGDDVEGFERSALPTGGMLEGVRFDKFGPVVLEHSSLMAHGLTAVKE